MNTAVQALLQYCLKMKMSYSYKPVLILALLKNHGKVSIQEAASFFIGYYGSRISQGLIAEKRDSIFSTLNCSVQEIQKNIMTNPVKALTSSSPLFKYNQEQEILTIQNYIWEQLNYDDIIALTEACHERLDQYYGKLYEDQKNQVVLFDDCCRSHALSSRFESDFSLQGNHFISLAHYMAYQKAIILGAERKSRQILSLSNQSLVDECYCELARMRNPLWDGQQPAIIYQGVAAKYSQNEAARRELLNTGHAIIGACLSDEDVLGIGMPIDDPEALQVDFWKGHNLLGNTLMQVRRMVWTF